LVNPTRRCIRKIHEGGAECPLKIVQKLLARLDLAINPRKTAIQHVEKGFDYLGERFFIRHRGTGDEMVMVRPLKSASAHHTMAAPRRLPPARTTQSNPGDEDVWEHST
jgi:hypothetical protein